MGPGLVLSIAMVQAVVVLYPGAPTAQHDIESDWMWTGLFRFSVMRILDTARRASSAIGMTEDRGCGVFMDTGRLALSAIGMTKAVASSKNLCIAILPSVGDDSSRRSLCLELKHASECSGSSPFDFLHRAGVSPTHDLGPQTVFVAIFLRTFLRIQLLMIIG